MFGMYLFLVFAVALCILTRPIKTDISPVLVYDSLPRDIWDETNASPDWFFLACEYPRTVVEANPTEDANFTALMSLADDTTAQGSKPESSRFEYFMSYSLVELRDLAKEKKVPGWSRMRKAQLAETLADNDLG